MHSRQWEWIQHNWWITKMIFLCSSRVCESCTFPSAQVTLEITLRLLAYIHNFPLLFTFCIFLDQRELTGCIYPEIAWREQTISILPCNVLGEMGWQEGFVRKLDIQKKLLAASVVFVLFLNHSEPKCLTEAHFIQCLSSNWSTIYTIEF